MQFGINLRNNPACIREKKTQTEICIPVYKQMAKSQYACIMITKGNVPDHPQMLECIGNWQ